MRIGTNPLKHSASLPGYKRHRVIVPVYIPSCDGYFASALHIFRMSFESLLATVDAEHVSISVIDNGSIPEVGDLLAKAFEEGRIDRLIRNAVNRGKPDAVASELLASYETFVTLADCDVLFLHGWLKAAEEIFATWPSAGAVSPSAQPKTAFYSNDTTWAYGALTGQVRAGKYVSDEDMLQFAHSVGNADLYSKRELGRQFVLARKGITAVMGAGHFVITLRRSCYSRFDYEPRLEGTGRGMRAIDAPVDQHGWLRLSTTRAYVLHMGNTPEPWMEHRLGEVRARTPEALRPTAEVRTAVARDAGTRVPRPVAIALAYLVKLGARAFWRFPSQPAEAK